MTGQLGFDQARGSGWRTVAGLLAIGGALLIISCLYLLDWWSDDFGTDTKFLDFAGDCGYGSQECGPLNDFGASFFVWGHLVFTLIAVLTAIAIWWRAVWPSAVGAGLCVLCALWMARALAQPGVINTEVTRTFAYWGAALIVLAVVIRLVESASRHTTPWSPR